MNSQSNNYQSQVLAPVQNLKMQGTPPVQNLQLQRLSEIGAPMQMPSMQKPTQIVGPTPIQMPVQIGAPTRLQMHSIQAPFPRIFTLQGSPSVQGPLPVQNLQFSKPSMSVPTPIQSPSQFSSPLSVPPQIQSPFQFPSGSGATAVASLPVPPLDSIQLLLLPPKQNTKSRQHCDRSNNMSIIPLLPEKSSVTTVKKNIKLNKSAPERRAKTPSDLLERNHPPSVKPRGGGWGALKKQEIEGNQKPEPSTHR